MIPQTTNFSTLTPEQNQLRQVLARNIQGGASPPGLSPGDTANWIQQSVATPLLQQYDTAILPRLKDSFAAIGALNSSRRGYAAQQSLDNLQSAIAAELAKAQLETRGLASQQAMNFNQLASQQTSIPQMAVQPYIDWSGVLGGGANGLSGILSPAQRPLAGIAQRSGGMSPAGLSFSSYLQKYLPQNEEQEV